jgi:hypothetical protein
MTARRHEQEEATAVAKKAKTARGQVVSGSVGGEGISMLIGVTRGISDAEGASFWLVFVCLAGRLLSEL